MNKSGIVFLAALTVLTALPVGAQELEWIHPQEEGLSWAPHFSRIVAHQGGRTIYIAPMAATDADSNIVGVGDLEAQARYIYRKLETALDAARPEHVVSHRQYVVGLSAEDAPMLGQLMLEFYPEGGRPAAALLGIETLIDPDLKLEFEIIAVVPE